MRDIARRRRDGSALGSTIDRLFLVGRVGNLYPVLIATWQKCGGDRNEILRLFEAFVFRVYRVVRRYSHTGASSLNWAAREVHRDNLSAAAFIRWFRELTLNWASDHTFRRELSGTHCYGSLGTRTIKYLLAQYERTLGTKVGEPMRVPLAEILSSEYETEHILPQHPAGDLDEEEMAAHQEIVHRLGNLTIASKEWNRSMGNRPFEEKRDGQGQPDDKCYRNSSLRVQRKLAEWKEWNESSIQDRGATIIAFALERWRIDPTPDPEAKAAHTSG